MSPRRVGSSHPWRQSVALKPALVSPKHQLSVASSFGSIIMKATSLHPEVLYIVKSNLRYTEVELSVADLILASTLH